MVGRGGEGDGTEGWLATYWALATTGACVPPNPYERAPARESLCQRPIALTALQMRKRFVGSAVMSSRPDNPFNPFVSCHAVFPWPPELSFMWLKNNMSCSFRRAAHKRINSSCYLVPFYLVNNELGRSKLTLETTSLPVPAILRLVSERYFISLRRPPRALEFDHTSTHPYLVDNIWRVDTSSTGLIIGCSVGKLFDYRYGTKVNAGEPYRLGYQGFNSGDSEWFIGV